MAATNHSNQKGLRFSGFLPQKARVSFIISGLFLAMELYP